MKKMERLNQKLERALAVAAEIKVLKQQRLAIEKEQLKRKKAQADARRKALIGAIVLNRWQTREISTSELIALIGSQIKLRSDFDLFQDSNPNPAI